MDIQVSGEEFKNDMTQSEWNNPKQNIEEYFI